MRRSLMVSAVLFVVSAFVLSGCLTINTGPTEATPTPTAAATQPSGAPLVPTATPSPYPTLPAPPVVTATSPAPTLAPIGPTATAGLPSTGGTPIGANGNIPISNNPTILNFLAGTNAYTWIVNLTPDVPQTFGLRAQANQTLYLTKNGPLSLQVYGPNQQPLTQRIGDVGPTKVTLPSTGLYYIGVAGVGQGAISAYIPRANSTSQAPAPIPASPQRIAFNTGSTSTTVTANLTQGQGTAYVFGAKAGQQATITMNDQSATLALIGPNNQALPANTSFQNQWTYNLPSTGDYTLVLLGNNMAQLTLSIPALPQMTPTPQSTSTPQPTPAANQRVTIPPGYASVTYNLNLTTRREVVYIVRVLQGQTLYASATNGAVIAFFNQRGVPLPTTHSQYSTRWSTQIPATGDYYIAVIGSSTTQVVIYIPPQ